MSFIKHKEETDVLQIKLTKTAKEDLKKLAQQREMTMAGLIKTLLQLEADYGVINLCKNFSKE